MKREWIVGLVTLGAMNVAMAQTLPPAPSGNDQRVRDRGEGGDEGPGGRPRPGAGGSATGDRSDGPPGRGEGRPDGRPGAGGPDGRMFGPRNNPTEAMKQYLDLVDKYAALAKDPSATGVSAVVTLTELAKQRGDAAGVTSAIEVLTKLLGETKDATIIRAIRLQLIDLYRSAGRFDKAIEQAEILIRGS